MELGYSILKVLAYFDLFDYPVSEEEIFFFLDRRTESRELSQALSCLLAKGCIFSLGGFYSLRHDETLVERRIEGNRQAQALLKIASRVSRMLYRFPYVRGISISGSLSKNVADENADIDYFIITAPNRLWIARTFMHIFKKLSFLVGREDWYCMNYYVDEQALLIEEKNIFTATEIVTLLPACGNGALDGFFEANEWAHAYFPNYASRPGRMRAAQPRSWFKAGVEALLNNRFGDALDNNLFRLTTRRWAKKASAGALNKKGDLMRLKTAKHFSRPDPTLLQTKIITLFDLRMKVLEDKWPEYFPQPVRPHFRSSSFSAD